MGKFLKLFRQTLIYGVATILPRIISVILVRIHTDKDVISEVSEFGTLSLIFSYIILFNVILSYGLETSFFRFYNKEKNKKDISKDDDVIVLELQDMSNSSASRESSQSKEMNQEKSSSIDKNCPLLLYIWDE